MKHWMLDLECLGNEKYPVISQIGLCSFDPNKLDSIEEELDIYISVPDSLANGFSISTKTYNWWLKQSSLGRPQKDLFIDQLTGTTLVKDALQQVRNLINFKDAIWSHATYDTVVLGNAFDLMGMQRPWPRKKEYDLRTLHFLSEDLGFGNKMKAEAKIRTTEKHDALADAEAQADMVCYFFSLLKAK